jgi:hypothetical protein
VIAAKFFHQDYMGSWISNGAVLNMAMVRLANDALVLIVLSHSFCRNEQTH